MPTETKVIQSANAFPLASLTAFNRSGIGSGAAIVLGMFHRSASPVQRQDSSESPTYSAILAFSLADRLEGRGIGARTRIRLPQAARRTATPQRNRGRFRRAGSTPRAAARDTRRAGCRLGNAGHYLTAGNSRRACAG